MIYFFSDKITARLYYTLDFIFKHNFNLEYVVITNELYFNSVKGIKLNYSKSYKNDCINIKPAGIIFEENYKKINVSFVLNGDWKLLLFPDLENEEVPFDLFSSIFWLISRYEEYDANKYDEHKRFKYDESLLYKANMLNVPVVDVWICKLKELIERKFNVTIGKNNLKFLSTIDVDNLYAFKGKNFFRTSGTAIKQIFLKNYNFFQNYLIYYLKGEDVYDSYDKVIELHNKIGYVPIFFVLTINKKTKFDRNIPCYSKHFIDKIKFISEKSEVAIHFSYYSTERGTLQIEKEHLQKLIGKKITKSRFHYLRFQIPESYRQLIKCEVEHDFSMGYSETTGFRAGTCCPFYFFDLDNNKQSSLIIHPFPFMDRFFIKNNFSEKNILHCAKDYLSKIANFGGEFVLAWHNENLHTIKKTNYFYVYKTILENASLLTTK